MKLLLLRCQPFERQAELAYRVAVHQPAELELAGLAFAAVVVGLAGAGYHLVVAMLASRCKPAASSQTECCNARRIAFAAAFAVGTAAQVVVVGKVEQVIQGEQVVVRQRGAALVQAGALAAAVVCTEGKAVRVGLLPQDDQVAVPWRSVAGGGWFDTDVGLGRGHPLEVFQPLFDIAQVQQVACLHRQSVGRMQPFGGWLGVAYIADAAWDQRQRQHAGSQLLRPGQYAGGDVATRQNGSLYPVNHQIDACHVQTMACQYVFAAAAVTVGGYQYPLESGRRCRLLGAGR